MQILVVVANIQARTLKAEVEKGFLRTAVGQELIDPKSRINLVKDGRSGSAGLVPPSGGAYRFPSPPKVVPNVERESGLTFPNLDSDAGRRRDRTRRRRPLPREEFSFLIDGPDDPGIVSYGERVGWPAERSDLRSARSATVVP